jgi:aspartyl/glutamyl-tRNA(Asn/Gln) amidotransferase C subunit
MDYNVTDIAQLAHIHISDAKNQKLGQDFGHILEYITALSDLELEAVTVPTYYTQHIREDIGFESNPRFSSDTKQHILEEMPLVEDGYLVVKSVLKHS